MPDVHPEAEEILDRLVEDQHALFGDDLVGTYLFGSAATGDFEPGVSDVDTVAVLRSDPTAQQLSDLDALHRAIVEDSSAWDDRVEAVYLSVAALSAFRARGGRPRGPVGARRRMQRR